MANQDLIVHAKLVRQTARPAKEITADFASIKKAVDETGKASTTQARDMDRLAREYNRLTRQQKEFADKLKHTGSQMTLGFTVPVLAGLGAATKRFSDLNEAADAAFRTLGKGYDRIAKLADVANAKLGMSKREVFEAGTNLAGLLQSAGLSEGQVAKMTEDLIRRGVDLGSKYNKSNQVVQDALVSGLIGESEPLRRLNVFVSDAAVKQEAYRSGIARTGAELTDAQKIQARYNLIMQGSVGAANNFVLTQDGIANKSKTARASLEDMAATYGEKLAPAMTEILDKGIAILEFFADLPDGVQTGILAMMGIAAVIGPVVQLTGSFINLGIAIRGASAAAGAGGAVGAAGGIGALLGPAAVTAAIAAPVIGGYAYLNNRDSKKKAELEAAASFRMMYGLDVTDPAAVRARYESSLRIQAGHYAEAKRLQALAERAYQHGGVEYNGRRLVAGTWDRELQAAAVAAQWQGDAMKPKLAQLADASSASFDQLTASITDTSKATEKLTSSSLEQRVRHLFYPFDVANTTLQKVRDQMQEAQRDLEKLGGLWDSTVGRMLGRDANALSFQRTINSAIEALKGTDGLSKQEAIIDIFSGAQANAQWQLDNRYIAPDQFTTTLYGNLLNAFGQLGPLSPELQAQVDSYMVEVQSLTAQYSTMVMANTLAGLRTRMGVAGGFLPGSLNVPLGDSRIPFYRGAVLGHDGALTTTLGMYGGLSSGLGTRISNALVGQHPGSDHFRGRALDLVGSGLPAMQARLIAAGGRAEFHGLGAGRHLHTVYPSGDSAHGYSSSMDNRNGTTVNNTFNVNVTARHGQQAHEVVAELRAELRSARERGVPWP